MVEAKDEIYKLRSEAEKEIKDRRSEIGRQEHRIQQKEENLDKKTDNLDRKEESLKQRLKNADKKLAEAEEVKNSQLKELERISGLTQDQAKEYILSTSRTSVRKRLAAISPSPLPSVRQIRFRKRQFPLWHCPTTK